MSSRLEKNKTQHGAAAVELALILPILLLMVGGAVEFGRAFWFYDTLSKATRDAARYASMAHCYSGETQTDCLARLGNVVSKVKAMVTTAAAASRVTEFDDTKVEVRCDGVVCTTNPDVMGSIYVTIAIVNYRIKLGEWLPLNYSGGGSAYNPHIQPSTTMRYMGG